MSNPFSNARREAKRYRDEFALDLAIVEEVADNSNHLIRVRVIEPTGESEPFGVPVLMKEHGDVHIPEQGSFVVIGYTRGRVPFVLGTVYKSGDSVPSHRVCERILGHAESNSQIKFNCDGSINLDTSTFTVTADTTNINSTTINIGDETSTVNINGETVLINNEPPGTGTGTGATELNSINRAGRLFPHDGTAESIHINNDGSLLITTDSDTVYFHDIDPYDVTTAQLTVSTINISTETTSAQDAIISGAGTRLYVLDETDIYEYSFSTPYDPTTVSYVTSHTVATSVARGFSLNSSNTRFYVCDSAFVYTTEMSTANDLSTATNVNSKLVREVNDVHINSDETKLYVSSSTDNSPVTLYTLDTPGDVSTLDLIGYLDTGGYFSNGLFVKDDESSLWVIFELEIIKNIASEIPLVQTVGGGSASTSSPPTENWAFYAGNNNDKIYKVQIETQQEWYNTEGFKWGSRTFQFPFTAVFDYDNGHVFSGGGSFIWKIDGVTGEELDFVNTGSTIDAHCLDLDGNNLYIANGANFVARTKANLTQSWSIASPNSGSFVGTVVSSTGRIYSIENAGATMYLHEHSSVDGSTLNSLAISGDYFNTIVMDEFGNIYTYTADEFFAKYDPELVQQWERTETGFEPNSIATVPGGGIIVYDYNSRSYKKIDTDTQAVLKENGRLEVSTVNWAACTPEYYISSVGHIDFQPYQVVRMNYETLELDFFTRTGGNTYTVPPAISSGTIHHFPENF